MTIILFIIGIVLLVAGAELLVRGASRLAVAVGISPLVIGLTIVAFGTSAPEMAVSVASALSGQSGADIAIGNVVGSNIFNVLLILGISAMIAPLVVSQQLVRVDVPIMIGASVLMFLFSLDHHVGRGNGLILFSGVIAYTVFAIVKGRRESRAVRDEYETEYGAKEEQKTSLGTNLFLILVGVVMLVVGSNWLVDGAIAIARALGVSELIIGLTIVSAGTSLPEVATSVMASIRGERDIAVGNVVGSNIFNILAVLGLASIVSPDGVNVSASAMAFDIPVMIAVAFACLPIFFTGYAISRWEGMVFLGYYMAYTAFLIMAASRYESLDELGRIMLLFVIPLTLLTLAITSFREWRSRRRPSLQAREGGP